jgi:hypothetical protein
MSKLEQPLDADELMILAERIEQLSADDAEWVNRLLQELLRARAHEGELLAGQASSGQQGRDESEFDEQMAQVALDTAEWLKTLWEVGYMGAGNFRAQPRAAFPALISKTSGSLRCSRAFAKAGMRFPSHHRRGRACHGTSSSKAVRRRRWSAPRLSVRKTACRWARSLKAAATGWSLRKTPRSRSASSSIRAKDPSSGCCRWTPAARSYAASCRV